MYVHLYIPVGEVSAACAVVACGGSVWDTPHCKSAAAPQHHLPVPGKTFLSINGCTYSNITFHHY